jgi:rare lipoprotein A (peptidoglycan hydrolase)
MVRLVISAIMIAIIATSAWSQADDTTLIYEQTVISRRADSLKSEWSRLWRMSDSLRIEAMLFRMKSDSVRRSVPADQYEIEDSMAVLLNARAAAARIKSGKVGDGQTLSDSVTFYIMSVEGDSGIASFYADEFHGRRTSSGELYNMNDLTCAHRWLPFGAMLKVVNVSNGNEVTVRVNDRGPFKHGRVIDLSKKAAQELGFVSKGTAFVRIYVVR